MQIEFATESAESRAPQLISERAVNMFVERQGQGSKSPTPMFGAPGLTALATLPSGTTRGCWLFNGVAYFVIADGLWSVSSAGVTAQVGAGIQGLGLVSMSDNGKQLAIVNGLQGYIYTASAGLVQITDPAFYPARTVRFMDGYFIFERLGTNEWFLSNLYDGLTYNGLDFASAEGAPGFTTTTFQNLQLLFVFASEHIEIWYDAGTFPFPFARYAGGIINYGCISPYTVVGQDGALFFLGTDKVFYRLQANVPIRVSTHSVEHLIAQEPDITQAYCSTFTLEGHKMVALTLPSTARTIVFDISTQRWHDRISWNGSGQSLGIWRANVMLEAYQKTLVGDAFGPQVGFIDWTNTTEYGNPIPGQLVSTTIAKDRLRLFMTRFELDVEAGVGNANDPGADPIWFLQISRDGGLTWPDAVPGRSMGKQGAYTQRLRWLRQGQARQFTFMLTTSAAVQRVVIGAYADIEPGLN